MLKHNFRNLKIWKDGVDLAKDIYIITQTFPNEHKFGLSSQLYRCAVSIPSNIAEGSGRGSPKEFAQFLKISLGSAFELETQLVIGQTCQLIPGGVFDQQIEVVQTLQRQIAAFIKTIEV